MSYLGIALQGAWKVLLAGLVLGAGLPAVYGLGLRALTLGMTDEERESGQPHPIGKFLFGVSLAVVAIGLALGLTFIIAGAFGGKLVFDGVVPHVVPK